MSIAKLLKQKKAIEAQIAKAEQVAKNNNRVERVVLKLMHKNSELFAIELAVLEKALARKSDVQQPNSKTGWGRSALLTFRHTLRISFVW